MTRNTFFGFSLYLRLTIQHTGEPIIQMDSEVQNELHHLYLNSS